MHTSVIWEEKSSVVHLPLPDWPMGTILGHFLDYRLKYDGHDTVGNATPGQMVLFV